MNPISTCNRQLDLNYYCCIGSSLPPLYPPVAPSANSVSSFLAFEVLQEEKTLLVFLYREFEEDAIQDDSLSNLPKRYFKAHWLKWQTPLEKVRWVVLCTGSNIIAVSIHPSLTAVVLSKTNKSKYFSPSCVCDIFICINVNKCKTNKTQHIKV